MKSSICRQPAHSRLFYTASHGIQYRPKLMKLTSGRGAVNACASCRGCRFPGLLRGLKIPCPNDRRHIVVTGSRLWRSPWHPCLPAWQPRRSSWRHRPRVMRSPQSHSMCRRFIAISRRMKFWRPRPHRGCSASNASLPLKIMNTSHTYPARCRASFAGLSTSGRT